MLESDRLGLASGAEDVIKADIENLLNEYFCLKKRPTVLLEGDGRGISISIEASAKAVKKFNILK